MFKDSLVESTKSIRTRSKWFAIASFAFEAVVLAIFLLIPYIYPAALPTQALASLLVAPPPPAAPPPVVHAAPATPHVQAVNLTVVPIIPHQIASPEAAPAPPQLPKSFGYVAGGDALSQLASAPPPAPVIRRAAPSGPVRVSSGVAAGRLLAPIQPIYPPIAQAAHIQGTVVIDAVISAQGLVTQARVVSGQPMLAQAALSAVSRARYQPYRLNGQPVEVETIININFVLGD